MLVVLRHVYEPAVQLCRTDSVVIAMMGDATLSCWSRYFGGFPGVSRSLLFVLLVFS
ncbi:BZ3500_MvSof-1268-A1-R1_Chr5-2g07713 [Microbotryum saponariae]|uniref:BZ3500_MvSof-1268-A1-R1_Chr5-2g07713 protein n=1 Tax=Microbotryum saponariae TaxID=289078 RepID=A0A2X0NDH5_9BASI|nr:BZ3500_MvSof-1268-A1-R1_Chr5-2g07713 [Microbotryum saponariae]SDA05582.1 BZ3501_MvSof-1269-A2-R1_Chr5-2g07535 [Microbotryum saponariae]